MSVAAPHRRMLTLAEVADRLAVSDKTARRLIARGELPCVQLGGRRSALRIDEDQLDAWLDRRRTDHPGGEA